VLSYEPEPVKAFPPFSSSFISFSQSSAFSAWGWLTPLADEKLSHGLDIQPDSLINPHTFTGIHPKVWG
jgi:hypothetical protein